MSKITEIKGHKYSRQSFDGYKFRAKFAFDTYNDDYPTNIDIYTTNSNKKAVENVINNRKSENVLSVKLIHWTTKEQDDLDNKFFNEILNSL